MEELDVAECRVLGSLVEKEATVPDSYPLTLNALRSACNQRSSRDPVLALSEPEVVEAAHRLRAKGLARLVHQPGSRAAKYKHTAAEALTLDEPSLAVLSVLLLRGPQTVGELRTRSERQFAFGSLDEVAHVLDRLAGREEPLVRLMPRQAGQKEQRWAELLGGEPRPATEDTETTETTEPAGPASGTAGADDVAELRARLDHLEERFEELLDRLGEDGDGSDGGHHGAP